MRRQTVYMFACMVVGMFAAEVGATGNAPPNVVFILADDLGYGDLSCYGATHFQTPACDRLAEEGMRFTDAHSPSAVCTPTRYSILTGRYAWRTWLKNWVLFGQHPLLIDTERLTMGELFQKAGYTTGCVGKWHLGWGTELNPDFSGEVKPGPLEVGFDSFCGLSPGSRFKGTTKAGVYGDFVVEFDWMVGELLGALDRNGLTDNTIVVLTSDNGPRPHASLNGHACSGPWRGAKRQIYEGGHRVPLIVRWPGKVKKQSTSDETVDLTDFFATFRALLKQPLPHDAGEDSYDLTNLLLAKPYKKPLREATVHHSVSGQFAIRKGEWKLIEGSGDGDYPRNDKNEIAVKTWTPKRDLSTRKWLKLDYFQHQTDDRFQLYNLKHDPGEKQDLATQHPEKVQELATLLQRYRKGARSAP